MVTIAVGLILLGALSCRHACAAEEIRADRSVTLRDSLGLERVWVGGVEVAFGKTLILADSARAREGEERVRFVGGISLRDSSRSVLADTLGYDRQSGVASFRGRARMEEADRALAAQRVRYHTHSGRMEADGGVDLRYPDQGVTLRAGSVSFHASGDSGRAIGRPRVLRVDGRNDTLEMSADSLRFAERGNQMVFAGDVRVLQGGFDARARVARYAHPEARLELSGEPEVAWGQVEVDVCDSVRIRAGRIGMELDKGRVSRIEMVDSASVRMVANRDSSTETRWLLADTCVVHVKGDRMLSVVATGRAEARLRSDQGDTTDFSGYRSRLVFGEGEVDSLIFEDAKEGTHRPSGGRTVSRLSGSWMAISFSGGHVRRIVSADQARCEHESLDTEETIRLSGDRVELSFQAGALDSAAARGGVRGSYVPAKTGEEP